MSSFAFSNTAAAASSSSLMFLPLLPAQPTSKTNVPNALKLASSQQFTAACDEALKVTNPAERNDIALKIAAIYQSKFPETAQGANSPVEGMVREFIKQSCLANSKLAPEYTSIGDEYLSTAGKLLMSCPNQHHHLFVSVIAQQIAVFSKHRISFMNTEDEELAILKPFVATIANNTPVLQLLFSELCKPIQYSEEDSKKYYNMPKNRSFWLVQHILPLINDDQTVKNLTMDQPGIWSAYLNVRAAWAEKYATTNVNEREKLLKYAKEKRAEAQAVIQAMKGPQKDTALTVAVRSTIVSGKLEEAQMIATHIGDESRKRILAEQIAAKQAHLDFESATPRTRAKLEEANNKAAAAKAATTSSSSASSTGRMTRSMKRNSPPNVAGKVGPKSTKSAMIIE